MTLDDAASQRQHAADWADYVPNTGNLSERMREDLIRAAVLAEREACAHYLEFRASGVWRGFVSVSELAQEIREGFHVGPPD